MTLPAAKAGTEQLRDLMESMKQDVIDLARKVESLYYNRSSRCDDILDNCHAKNYEICLSTLPNLTCTVREEIPIEACNGCGAPFDDTVSTVRLPKEVETDDNNGNPTDFRVREQK